MVLTVKRSRRQNKTGHRTSRQSQLGRVAGGGRVTTDGKKCGSKPFGTWLPEMDTILGKPCSLFPVQISRDAVLILHSKLHNSWVLQSTIFRQLQKKLPHPINSRRERPAFEILKGSEGHSLHTHEQPHSLCTQQGYLQSKHTTQNAWSCIIPLSVVFKNKKKN